MKDISLHILDIMQNSLEAGANEINVEIAEIPSEDKYIVSIRDNGKGMTLEMAEKVTDPFYTTRTTRKVGMGIPMIKAHAERTGGTFELKTETGRGTEIRAIFSLNHVDRQPLGDIAGTIVLTAVSHPMVKITYNHSTSYGEFTFDTNEVKQVLDDTPINSAEVIRFLKEMITENLENIKYTP